MSSWCLGVFDRRCAGCKVSCIWHTEHFVWGGQICSQKFEWNWLATVLCGAQVRTKGEAMHMPKMGLSLRWSRICDLSCLVPERGLVVQPKSTKKRTTSPTGKWNTELKTAETSWINMGMWSQHGLSWNHVWTYVGNNLPCLGRKKSVSQTPPCWYKPFGLQSGHIL